MLTFVVRFLSQVELFREAPVFLQDLPYFFPYSSSLSKIRGCVLIVAYFAKSENHRIFAKKRR